MYQMNDLAAHTDNVWSALENNAFQKGGAFETHNKSRRVVELMALRLHTELKRQAKEHIATYTRICFVTGIF